jgi:hypothetical protein
MGACGVLLAGAVVAAVAWSGRPFTAPSSDAELTSGEFTRRFVWHAAITVTTGVVGGIATIGVGGRLAMRLLAVTAGHAAQGRVTEADEIVGRITTDGTLGFIIFEGIFGGLLVALLLMLLRRALPAGPGGGAAMAVGLLVILGTTVDPLRRNNPDFDIVGPGALAVVVFVALAFVSTLTIQGLQARMSAWLPLVSKEGSVLLRYLVPAAICGVAFIVFFVLVPLFVVSWIATRSPNVVALVRSRQLILGERILAGGLVIVFLPNAIVSIATIATG